MQDLNLDDKNLFEALAALLAEDIDPSERAADLWERYGQERAVMVLDSSGFSRVSEQHGIIHFLSRLVLMRNLVAPVLRDNGYHEFHFQADNIFATFNTPDEAIRAAVEAHRTVHRNNLMLTDEEPFRVCIGIGYGRLLYSETLEGYFGEEMNLASKLGEDVAEGGETLITANAYAAASPDVLKGFAPEEESIAGLDLHYYKRKLEFY